MHLFYGCFISLLFIGLVLLVGLVNTFQWLKLPGRDGKLIVSNARRELDT